MNDKLFNLFMKTSSLYMKVLRLQKAQHLIGYLSWLDIVSRIFHAAFFR